MIRAIVGAQWGDEGKGRLVDYFAQEADVVIRYQGGDNAGHTVINDYGKFALHIIPSGIFNPKALNVIGAGCVVNLEGFLNEVEVLKDAGVNTDNLIIDPRAHVVFDYHIALDQAREGGGAKIGSTKRGIAPVYADKAARFGLRIGDLLHTLDHHLNRIDEHLNRVFKESGSIQADPSLRHLVHDSLLSQIEEVRPYVRDSLPEIRYAQYRDKNILLEGQLGVMRDLDYGPYPYVTSSHPASFWGSGIPSNAINEIVGVVKAYTTKVGDGPLPTAEEPYSAALRDLGGEYGATTGRPRDCGWLDLFQLRYANQLVGFDSVALTKVDVLSQLEDIKVCVAYEGHSYMPWNLEGNPIYKKMGSFFLEEYVDLIEITLGVPVKWVSNGPERESLLVRGSAETLRGF